MRISKLIIRNLIHFRRTHAGLVFGSLMATAVLTGALIVGDSMRFSLRQMSLQRLGKTVHAITSGDLLFDVSLASRLEQTLEVPVASVLQTRGLARVSGGRQVNAVQVYGVTESLIRFAHEAFDLSTLDEDEVLINEILAVKLNVKAGDSFILRFEKEMSIPGDLPLTSREMQFAAMRVKVKNILSSQQLGHFSLRISQIPSPSLFMPLHILNRKLELETRANILLIGDNGSLPLTQEIVRAVFQQVWKPSDMGLSFQVNSDREIIQLVANRIFLDENVTESALDIGKSGSGVLTYFTNRITSSSGMTPYSFVTAIDLPLPYSMNDKDVVIGPWLARDLQIVPGDSVTLSYFVVNETSELLESTSRFQIHSILPFTSPLLNESFMPDIPGLSDSENCRDWDPGIPIDLDLIRQKDEDYWSDFRGTPKAFITLNAGQQLWANRFGHLTAIQYPQSMNTLNDLEADLQNRLDPFSLGFQIHPVREEALQASDEGVDFGQLFIGLSFFIMASALMLLGLFFVFTVEQRHVELGLFEAVGFQQKQIRKLLILEGGILAFIGTVMGTGAGLLFTRLILQLLGSLWQGAVQTSGFELKVMGSTLLIGAGSSLAMALITLMVSLRVTLTKTIVHLQQPGFDHLKFRSKKRKLGLAIFFLGLLGAVLILLIGVLNPEQTSAGAFFGSGALLILSGLGLCMAIFMNLLRFSRPKILTTRHLIISGTARRWGRSLTTIGLLASTLFIVIGVGSNRHGTLEHPEKRESGTGGFALWAEIVLPVKINLNGDEGHTFLSLEDSLQNYVRFLQLRLKEGDDASCLNLNRVQRPAVLGVNPAQLNQRSAFSFIQTSDDVDSESPWLVLDKELDNGVVPAIADQTVILWGLGKAIGDTLIYQNDHGENIVLQLVGGLQNSIFQGHIIISEKNFIRLFPSISGTRLFLVD
ncbi:ABC transporter permease, partial [candidate division KSB1 bacterium]|nr:ABC transporter permease [candidate division KSB1 bacterium]